MSSLLTVMLLVSILFFTVFPAGKYILFVKKFLVGGGNIHFCGRSISLGIFKIANLVRPGFFSVCPPLAYVLYPGILFIYVIYHLRGGIPGNIVKIILAVFMLNLTLVFSSHIVAAILGYGTLPILSRVYNIFFPLLGLTALASAYRIYDASSKASSLIEASIFILLLVILGQPVFAPWYFLWLTPLILLLDDEKKMLYLMAALLFTQPVFYYGPPYYFKALLP
ncbi:MAG: hypothetical protein ABH834_01370 [Candidatus Altiarchaeota archaeon]